MNHPPDYKFSFEFRERNVEAKTLGYDVWIGPNKDTLEIVKGGFEYTQLSEEYSSTLFKILTGHDL